MPSARDARAAERTARPDAPFGAPNPNEVFDILIPEGAATGKIPPGDQYIGKLLTLIKQDAKSSGNPMWVFTFTISEGKYAGMDFQIFCTLTPNSLWKLADTLAAIGIKFTPGQQVNFRLKDVLGVGVRMKIVDGKNQDGTRDISKLAGVLPHPDGAGYKDGKGAFVVPPKPEEPEEEEPEEEAPRARRGVRTRGYEEDEEPEEPVRRKRRPEPEEEEEEPEEVPRRRGRAAREEPEEEEPEDDEMPLLKAERAKDRTRSRAEPDEEEPEEAPVRRSGRTAPARRRSRL